MNNVIPLQTIGELADISDVPYPYLLDLLFLRKKPYRSFLIRKKGSKSRRLINVPSTPLLMTQKVINKYILTVPQIHPCATAYCFGSSPLANARFHCNSKTLIKMDIENFFHSFCEHDIYREFRKIGFDKLISFQLARLCIKPTNKIYRSDYCMSPIFPSIPNGIEYSYMPQGAATSPTLSNRLMIPFDRLIEKISNKYSFRYTRYSDDITMSSTERVDQSSVLSLHHDVCNVLSRKFTINSRKTKILHEGQRMIVTGLFVNNQNPQLLKEYKNRIRMESYYISKFGYVTHAERNNCDPYLFFLHFWGKVNWAKTVEPEFANKIKKSLKDVANPFDI